MENSLKTLVQQLFYYLDKEEESDSGRVFHPVHISCCRAAYTEKLDAILKRMKELSSE